MEFLTIFIGIKVLAAIGIINVVKSVDESVETEKEEIARSTFVEQGMTAWEDEAVPPEFREGLKQTKLEFQKAYLEGRLAQIEEQIEERGDE